MVLARLPIDHAWLELTRDNLAAGMIWSIITGPLLHITSLHLVLDVLGLLIIGWMLEPRLGRTMPIACIAANVAVAMAFIVIYPELPAYRGLSAMTHGVLAAGAAALWRQDERRLAATIGIALIGKCAFELVGDSVTAAALFGHVESFGSPVPWTHAIAAIVGTLVPCFGTVESDSSSRSN
jgi:rhomboid family GlyGly-CTERM serine protease